MKDLKKRINALTDLTDDLKYQVNKSIDFEYMQNTRNLITAVMTLNNLIDRYYNLDSETKEQLKRDIQFALQVEKQQMIEFAHYFSDLNKLTIEEYYEKNYNLDK